MKSPADLTQNDIEHILGIVDRLNDIEVRIETDAMKLHVRKFSDASLASEAAPAVAQPAQTVSQARAALPAAKPAQAVGGTPAAPPPAAAAARARLPDTRAPLQGLLFRAPAPSEPAYVEVGSRVQPEDTVCMLEVMKLFNTVPAAVAGTIVEILVENGAMVEHDAVLFRVRPE